VPLSQALQNAWTNYLVGQTPTAPAAPTMPITAILASTAGTATAAGTAVAAVTANPTIAAAGWNASATTVAASNVNAVSWTSNAAIATIVGVSLQDSAATPVYRGYGAFSGANAAKSMNSGDTLTIAGGAPGSLTVQNT